jgi:hypothetical protein
LQTILEEMRSFLTALLMGGVCAACGAGPPRPPTAGTGVDAAAAPAAPPPAAAADGEPRRAPAVDLPAGRFVATPPALPARREGLLITRPSRWGRLFELGSPAGSPGGHGTYWFVADGSAWAVYFASKGEGVNFLHDWQVAVPGGVERFDAAMYRPATADPWGLDDEAHLVAVEVNGGRGAPSWPHFVITGLQPLDGTVDASDALDDARARWQRHLADSTAALAAELQRAARQPVGPPLPGAESERIDEAFFPAWDAQARVLRVLHVRRVVRTTLRVDPAPPCQRMSKRPCRGPIEIRHGYGVEIGLEVGYGAGGALVTQTAFGPTAMDEKTLRAGGYVTGP